jgi:hypothetical protein
METTIEAQQHVTTLCYGLRSDSAVHLHAYNTRETAAVCFLGIYEALQQFHSVVLHGVLQQ